MRSANIGVNVDYIPVHTQPDYCRLGFERGAVPEAERYYAGAVSLPMYATLTDEQQDRVVAALGGRWCERSRDHPSPRWQQRIPRKNIRDFCGKPMIAWAIEAARRRGYSRHLGFDDDREIAAVSQPVRREVARSRGPPSSVTILPPPMPFWRTPSSRVIRSWPLRFGLLHPPDESPALRVRPSSRRRPADSGIGADRLRRRALRLPDPAGIPARGVHPRAHGRTSSRLVAGPGPRLPRCWRVATGSTREAPSGRKLFVEGAVVFEIGSDRCRGLNTPEDWQVAETSSGSSRNWVDDDGVGRVTARVDEVARLDSGTFAAPGASRGARVAWSSSAS